jgi:predicted nuclease of predicted toxin-antitoxin system
VARFYLDNDVDHRCRRVLVAAGHQCWATSEAGRSDAGDHEQAYYSLTKDAVTVTHDQEFTETRKRNTIGKHLCLRCEQPDGPALLKTWLDVLPELLDRHEHVVVELFPTSYRVMPGRWL